MPERERVEEIRIFFKFNKKTFAEVLGYAYSQNYTNFLGGSSNLSMKMIKGLKEYDSRININWILTGEGQMLLSSDNSNNQKIINGNNNNTQLGDFNNSDNSNNKNISVNSNNKEIKYLQKEIEHLKAALKEKEERLKDKDERLKDKEELISILRKNQK
jgi:uncharacterized small protein (DUF1192 family)